jgi:O-antigen/teichoic acid export membrane protein
MILVGKMDSVMVAALLGLEANALYTTAFYMATVIEIPKRAITSIASPLIATAFGKADMTEILTLYQKTSINQFIIGALLLVGVLINFPSIFQLMPKGDTYRAGEFVVVVIGIGKLLDMTFGPSSEIIGLSKYYWFNLVVISMLAITTVVSNYLLIPRLGINGAAYGSLIALVIYNVFKFAFIYWKLRIQPFTAATIKVTVITGVTFMIGYYLPRLSSVFPDIIYRSFIVTILYCALIFGSKVSPDINRLVQTVFSKARKILGR